MKTQIIISDGWYILKEYDFLITLTKGDYVTYNGVEYKVDTCALIIEEDKIEILITK